MIEESRNHIDSLDICKAFDSLEIQFLKQILKKFKFGTSFCWMIKHIDRSAKVQIGLNNYNSDPIIILRDTKQRCPLSLLLFKLALRSIGNSTQTR